MTSQLTTVPAAGGAAALTGAELGRALGDGRLGVHFQPIVSLPSRQVRGFEALARLTGEDGRPVPPGGFVPVAEAEGRVGDLGAEVLRQAVAAAGRWRRQPPLSSAYVGVNVSPRQLTSPGFVALARQATREHQVPVSAVMLEITENAAVDPSAAPVIHELASLGFRIALDDFGTGFANLDQLRRLPLQALKLDRSFVAEVGTPGRGRAVVRAAAQLAESMRLLMIAEGVEDDEQARLLHDLGCGYAQGFLFARPGPDPAEQASAVRRRAGRDREGRRRTAPLPWDRRVEEAALSAARVLAAPDDRVRGHAGALAARLAGTAGAGDATVYLAHRLALIHDLHRLPADLPLVADLLAAPGVRETVAGTGPGGTGPGGAGPGDPPPGHPGRDPDVEEAAREAVLVVRLAVAAAEAAAAADPAMSRRALQDGCRQVAAVAPRPYAALLRLFATEPLDARPVQALLRDLDQRRHRRLGVHDRLEAVAGLSRALTGTEDVVELLRSATEEARRIVGASAASLEEWDPRDQTVRTVVNVGELSHGEVAVPSDEVYQLADFSEASRLTTSGLPVVITRRDGVVAPEEAGLLVRLAKGSAAAVPIILDDRIWGELWVTTSLGEPDFGSADLELLTAVGALMSGVVSHARTMQRMQDLAFRDPLTGLANRRAVDDALIDLERGQGGVTVALLDVDGLKELNDAHGHARGDEVLTAVAAALREGFPAEAGWTVGRLGGDEFAVVGAGRDASVAERLGTAAAACRETTGGGFSWGVHTAAWPWASRDVLAAADAQLYRAKRDR
ncbi:MAG: EAL domain-containing protein [Kineosporiaceae bacterium]